MWKTRKNIKRNKIQMKTLFIVNSHSIIDVITNSSSELFVCKTDKTLETVKELLKSNTQLYGYCEPWIFNIDEYYEWKKHTHMNWWGSRAINEGEEEFDNPKFHMISGWFSDNSTEEDLMYIRKEIIEHGPKRGFGWFSGDHTYRERLANATKNLSDFKAKMEAEDQEIDKIYAELEATPHKPDWWENPLPFVWNSTSITSIDGCVMIESTDDNSIPFDEFDWIEETFHARRYHLG